MFGEGFIASKWSPIFEAQKISMPGAAQTKQRNAKSYPASQFILAIAMKSKESKEIGVKQLIARSSVGIECYCLQLVASNSHERFLMSNN